MKDTRDASDSKTGTSEAQRIRTARAAERAVAEVWRRADEAQTKAFTEGRSPEDVHAAFNAVVRAAIADGVFERAQAAGPVPPPKPKRREGRPSKFSETALLHARTMARAAVDRARGAEKPEQTVRQERTEAIRRALIEVGSLEPTDEEWHDLVEGRVDFATVRERHGIPEGDPGTTDAVRRLFAYHYGSAVEGNGQTWTEYWQDYVLGTALAVAGPTTPVDGIAARIDFDGTVADAVRDIVDQYERIFSEMASAASDPARSAEDRKAFRLDLPKMQTEVRLVLASLDAGLRDGSLPLPPIASKVLARMIRGVRDRIGKRAKRSSHLRK